MTTIRKPFFIFSCGLYATRVQRLFYGSFLYSELWKVKGYTQTHSNSQIHLQNANVHKEAAVKGRTRQNTHFKAQTLLFSYTNTLKLSHSLAAFTLASATSIQAATSKEKSMWTHTQASKFRLSSSCVDMRFYNSFWTLHTKHDFRLQAKFGQFWPLWD